VSSSDPFGFLREVAPEFEFLAGLEGGSYIGDAFGGDEDFAAIVNRVECENQAAWEARCRAKPMVTDGDDSKMRKPDPATRLAAAFANKIFQSTKDQPPVTADKRLHPRDHGKFAKPEYMNVPRRWMLPWPVNHFVWQAPEGSGKSSIVPELVARGFTVVFCSKSNDQLVEQERSFRARWPKLRVHRYISKGRHLQERLAELGIDFKPVYHEPLSPYSTSAIDEPSTRQALRTALDAAGHTDVDHVALFDKCYTTYKSPRIVGLDTNVVLLTIAAFQAFCTARHRPWWQALGLVSGMKRVKRKHRHHEDDYHPLYRSLPTEIPSNEPTPKVDEQGLPLVGVELGLPGIVVIIDDPDRTDFDSRRLIEDEKVAEIQRKRSALPVYQQQWVYVEHWTKMGYPPRLAAELAREYTDKAHAHEVESFQTRQYEARPASQHIGYALRRGFSAKDGWGPKIVVTTTENITTKLANVSLGKTMKWAPECVEWYSAHNSVRWYGKTNFRPTRNCHVTLLSTPFVRKGDRILLLLIAEQLRQEFPDEDLAFIADGLHCDLNLMNNRGRNDLADRSTLIKLSVPNPTVALNLWAQFPSSKRPKMLNTILLADLANQAIGRNQGNRYRGKQCMVLVDPMYANLLVNSGLLRYHCTPWSFHEPAAQALPVHYGKTPMESRLIELLARARSFGMSAKGGMPIGFNLPENQRMMYINWLDRNKVVYKHLL